MTAIVGGDVQLFERTGDSFFQRLDADLMIQDGKEVLDFDGSGAAQIFFGQYGVYFLLDLRIPSHHMGRLFEAAETAFAQHHHIHSLLFGQRQVSGGHQEKCLIIGIADGIAATFEFFVVRRFDAEFV